jgi:hypothetical protein
MKVWVVLVLGVAFLAGCGSNETNDNEKRGPANEETRFVTQMVTVEETTVVTEAPSVSQEQPPEDVLALQYEYINGGDFEEAYQLFAEQSRREVSLEQYWTFFEANAPYSVTDYSFSPAEIQADSASVDAEFTVTSASGVERLERTQEFVREGEDWRVVMRPEQVAAFTATDGEAETEFSLAPPEKDPSPEKESQPEEEGRSSAGIALTGSGQTATEAFELESGLAVFRMTHQGNRNFIVYLLDQNGVRVGTSLANEIGSFSGSKAIQIPRDGTYLLQVDADGPWTIQVD